MERSVPKPATDSSTVLQNLMKFCAEGRFCDVKIQIGDEVFEFQRSLLAAVSDFFDGMFRGDFKEGSDSNVPIILPELDRAAFREMMNSLRTGGKLNIDDDNIYPIY